MNFIAFVGPALRFLATGLTKLSGKADASPKSSALLTILGAGGAYFGLRPEDLITVGKALVAAGELVQRIAGGM